MKYQRNINLMGTSIYYNMSVSQSRLGSNPLRSNPYTVNFPNNGHFGKRPTVRYSGGVLYWGIIVTTFHVPCSKFLANISYQSRVNISQVYESTSNL